MPTEFKDRLLAANLVIEEAVEFVRAMGFEIRISYLDDKADEDNRGDIVLLESHTKQPNLIEACDAIGDILVVTYGAANRLGVSAEKIFDEVNRSNMTKVFPDGTIHRRESDGKVIKPSTYSPANIRQVLFESTEKSSREWVTNKFPKVRQAISQGQLDIWAYMATEACGEAFKFNYQLASQSDLLKTPAFSNIETVVKAAKVFAQYAGVIEDETDLADELGIDDYPAGVIYDHFVAAFPGIAPVRTQVLKPDPVLTQKEPVYSGGQRDAIVAHHRMGWSR